MKPRWASSLSSAPEAIITTTEKAPEKKPFDPENFEPVTIGPVWQTDEDGNWLLPERTLGWHAVAWAAENLVNDDGDPWMFTAEQLRFILWFYAIDDEGKFCYRTITLQRLKGWGKDPLAAIICLIELIGPCRFGGWDSTGEPIVTENRTAVIQIAAVSQSQTGNTMDLIPVYCPKRTRLKYDMTIGAEIVRAVGSTRKIEIITSSFRAQEGKRPSLVIGNEPHHWLSTNGGHGMKRVLDRNAAKSKKGSARILWITNAFLPGEDSIGEQNRNMYEKLVETGMLDRAGWLYDSLEAPSNAPLDPDVAPLVLKKIRGDSVWLDIPTLVQSIITNPSAADARRFWYNQIVADEETLVPPKLWDPLARPDLRLEEDDEIVLGFDGGKTDDASALVAIRLRDRAIFLLYLWEPDPLITTKQAVDATRVDGWVAYAFEHYNVRAFFADVSLWESYIDKWSDQYRDALMIKAEAGKSAIGYDMRGHQEEITRMNMFLVAAIRDQTVVHTGDTKLRRHVMNTKKKTNKWGMTFDKEHRESAKKNDAYAATLLAFIAMHRYLESGKRPKEEHSGDFWFF